MKKTQRWNFGYTKRSVFDRSKYSFIPSPDYYHGKTMSQFRTEKDFKKCTFGESYEALRPRVEIENKKILTNITFERVGPTSYTPLPNRVKKDSSKYSCGIKLPSMDDFL